MLALLVVAPPLAGLLWASGEVSLGAALGAMTLFVLVVAGAGMLLLRAANAADMPASAAWALGLFATAAGVYVLVCAFQLLAASAFGIWAALVLACSVLFRPAVRGVRGAELAGLLLCAGATLFWCAELAAVPQALAQDGALKTWTDQFIHGAAISQFGDPRAAGRQAIELADTPIPLYHYVSYMVPAVFAWPLDLPGLPLATSLWAPVGFFTLCASVYTLGAALAGAPGGLAALAALTLLPDPGTYGLHNRAFGYYWYVLAVPGASYGVGVALLSLAFLHRWALARSPRPLLAGAGLLAAAALIRVHVFLLALPAWLASVVMLAPWSTRRKLALSAAGCAAFVLFVAGYYRLYPEAVHALPGFLEITHQHHYPIAYQPPTTMVGGLLLIFPASLGAFVILYPLSLLLLHRARGLRAIDLVPAAFLLWYLLLMLSAPVPAHGDATELTQRPFVLVYAVIAIWTAAGFARWVALQGGLRVRRVWVSLLVLAALGLGGALLYTVPDARWLEVHQGARGLPQAARFLRSHSRPGDMLAVEGLTLERVYTDAAVQLVSLSGVPAYLSRPFIQAAKQIVLERHEALADIAQVPDAATALERLRRLGIQWYVVVSPGRVWDPERLQMVIDHSGPRWDRLRERAAFVEGSVAVYSSERHGKP
jgi:hypothetical protein